MEPHAILLLIFAGVLQCDATQPPTVKEPELRIELLRRAKTDQVARSAIVQWMKELGNNAAANEATFAASLDAARKVEFKQLSDTLARTDQENTTRLEEIVGQHGWPSHTLVGKDGAHAAWLLVQHADKSPQFQRKCLELMTKLPRDEISRTNVAYLTDRVLLAEGNKQLYGTQFTLTNGEYKPRPLEDEANVDNRRKEVGLPPLADYAKEIETLYGRK